MPTVFTNNRISLMLLMLSFSFSLLFAIQLESEHSLSQRKENWIRNDELWSRQTGEETFFPNISPSSSRLKTHSESLTLICTLEHIVRKWSKKLAFQIPAVLDNSKGSVISLTGESNRYCVQLSSVTQLLIMAIQEHTAISFQLYEPKDCYWHVN